MSAPQAVAGISLLVGLFTVLIALTVIVRKFSHIPRGIHERAQHFWRTRHGAHSVPPPPTRHPLAAVINDQLFPRLPGMQSVPDHQIRLAVSDLSSSIEAHAANFYDLTMTWDHPGCDYYPDTINSTSLRMLENPLMRQAAIQWIIAQRIVNSITARGKADPDTTFLPAGIVEIMMSIPQPEKCSHKQKQVFNLVLSTWRMLTSLLLRWSGAGVMSEAYVLQRTRNIEKAVNQLTEELHPFICGNPGLQEDLAQIMNRATDLGLLILQQPSQWGFYLPGSRGTLYSHGGVIVFPAIRENVDGNGNSPNRELRPADVRYYDARLLESVMEA